MYSGKFSNENHSPRTGRYTQHRRPSRGHKRMAALMVSLLILVTAVAGGTLAYLAAATDPVENKFTLGTVPIEIREDFNQKVKKNVTVTNNGNVDAYVRVMVAMTWKDKEGSVSSQPVTPADLNMKMGSKDWVKGSDGYYYYTAPLAAGKTTPSVIQSIAVDESRANIPEGYNLSVEILAQSVQADGVKNGLPMVQAIGWPVTVGPSGLLEIQ